MRQTVRSGHIDGVPVVFICEDQVVGWYISATVYRYIRHPALFLEGNVCADTRNVRLLKHPSAIEGMEFPKKKNYLVIESGDARYLTLKTLISEAGGLLRLWIMQKRR